MLDIVARRLLAAPLERLSTLLDQRWLGPNWITATGLLLGAGSAGLAASQWWRAALVLWLVSRLADGLDGALARRRRTTGKPATKATVTDASGLLDIVADFTVYGLTVAGVAFGTSAEFAAPAWPFMLVLVVYYVNGGVFLAKSSIAERLNRPDSDDRTFIFPVGFAGATETIVVHSLWLLFPAAAWQIATIWALVVGVNAVRQVVSGYRAFR